MEEIKRLLKASNEFIEIAQIQAEDKEHIENVIRLDFLTGAYEMCVVLEKHDVAKELKTLINQIAEEI